MNARVAHARREAGAARDKDIARAQALGRAAGRANRPVDENPYKTDRVLALRWVRAYVGAGGRHGIETVVERVRRAMRGRA